MRNFRTEGIIIKRRNFGEADRILTIITREYGKIYVKATGVRKITSRRSAHVELLNHTALSLYNGKSYPILVEARTIKNFSEIKSDLDTIGLAYHLCELIDGLCPEHQENRGVYELVQRTLHRFMSTEDRAVVVQDFEIELLSLLGYWNQSSAQHFTLNTPAFIESIIERKLKSRNIFAKLQ